MNRWLHEHRIAFLYTLFPGEIQQLLWEQNGNQDVVDLDGVEVFKQRHSPRLTIRAHRSKNISVFDITRRLETVFENGEYGAGCELFVSTHP
ncbi:hypothetical protein NPIL_602241 [Nephila pilipes]|uniref:Uncharacterized protein n=1 Tax=Nephila pilipes TaxID=299642 RepID=A0A8X6TIL1_NEPPI|nr:hypothetical protein NPIL_602241 [Nephila pilipes]